MKIIKRTIKHLDHCFLNRQQSVHTCLVIGAFNIYRFSCTILREWYKCFVMIFVLFQRGKCVETVSRCVVASAWRVGEVFRRIHLKHVPYCASVETKGWAGGRPPRHMGVYLNSVTLHIASCKRLFMLCLKFQDYHVIFLYSWDAKTCLVYDLDSELPFPTFFHKYVTETFRTDQVLKSDFHR